MAAHRPISSHPALLVASAVLALTSVTGCESSDADPTDDAAAPATSETPAATPTETETAEVTPIDGTWTSPTLAPTDFRRALTAHGLGTHADAFLADFGRAVVLTLEVGGGFWTLSSSIDGGATAVTDRGSFEIDDQQVKVLPNSGGTNTFRWKVAGDELTLDLVSTTEPPYEGVPAEVFQSSLYTTSPFTLDAP